MVGKPNRRTFLKILGAGTVVGGITSMEIPDRDDLQLMVHGDESYPGETATVDFTLTNTGSELRNRPEIRFGPPLADWGIEPVADAGGQRLYQDDEDAFAGWQWDTLDAGETVQPSTLLHVPVTAEPGEYALTPTVADQNRRALQETTTTTEEPTPIPTSTTTTTEEPTTTTTEELTTTTTEEPTTRTTEETTTTTTDEPTTTTAITTTEESTTTDETSTTPPSTTIEPTTTTPSETVPTTQDGTFKPDVEFQLCFAAVVTADSYDQVTLYLNDGATEEFTGEYHGEQRFGYRGDRTLPESAETYDTFHGRIQEVEVSNGNETASFENPSSCEMEIDFSCSSLTMDGLGEGVLEFADGSEKSYFGGFTGTRTVGSPGRKLERILIHGVYDLTVPNPHTSCEPEAIPATMFDCTEVTIGPDEFLGKDEPTFSQITLNFTDGTSQQFDESGNEGTFTAPETFRGTGEYEGKVIQRVDISVDMMSGYQLVNPDTDNCSPQDRSDETETNSDTSDIQLSASGGSTTPGETVQVDFEVRNTDTQVRSVALILEVPENWEIAEHFDDGGSWRPRSGFAYVPMDGWEWEIEPETTKQAWIRLDVPENAASGDHTIRARHQAGDVVFGSTSATVTVTSTTTTQTGESNITVKQPDDASENSEADSTSEEVLFETGFEDYTTETYPRDWVKAGNQNQAVVSTTAGSGSKSLRMSGAPGGCWEAISHYPTQIPSSGTVRIAGKVRPTTDGSVGCHTNKRGKLVLRTEASQGTYPGDGITLFELGPDGTIRGMQNADHGTYQTDTWQDFTVAYNRSDGTVTQTLWWNGDERGSATRKVTDFEDDLSAFSLQSGDFTIYWDDFSITQILESENGKNDSDTNNLVVEVDNFDHTDFIKEKGGDAVLEKVDSVHKGYITTSGEFYGRHLIGAAFGGTTSFGSTAIATKNFEVSSAPRHELNVDYTASGSHGINSLSYVPLPIRGHSLLYILLTIQDARGNTIGQNRDVIYNKAAPSFDEAVGNLMVETFASLVSFGVPVSETALLVRDTLTVAKGGDTPLNENYNESGTVNITTSNLEGDEEYTAVVQIYALTGVNLLSTVRIGSGVADFIYYGDIGLTVYSE